MENNYNFLSKMMEGKHPYWVVQKHTWIRGQGDTRLGKDQIILICIPDNVQIDMPYSMILYKDIADFRNMEIRHNMFLNEDFLPFQKGITLVDVCDGFPLDREDIKTKEFLSEAIMLDSDSLEDYRMLYKSIKSMSLKKELIEKDTTPLGA